MYDRQKGKKVSAEICSNENASVRGISLSAVSQSDKSKLSGDKVTDKNTVRIR